jgi:two-component system OmpR family response regulator
MAARPARVLVADDELDIVEMLRDFLVDEGYDVATAGTGAEALAALDAFRPDVLLLDLAMPGISGAEVLDTLRRRGDRTPVVVISGRLDAQAPADVQVVDKPFSLSKIGRAIAAALGRGSGGA